MSETKKDTQPNDNPRLTESLKIRGLCSALQAMSMPTVENLISLAGNVDIKLEVVN